MVQVSGFITLTCERIRRLQQADPLRFQVGLCTLYCALCSFTSTDLVCMFVDVHENDRRQMATLARAEK